MKVTLIKKKCGARRLQYLKCTLFIIARDNEYFLYFAKLVFFVSPLTRIGGLIHLWQSIQTVEGFFPFLFFSPFEHNPLSLHPQSTSQIAAGVGDALWEALDEILSGTLFSTWAIYERLGFLG